MKENSPDEDVLAIDCSLEYHEQAVRVQVKCTSQRKLDASTTIAWPIEDRWRQKWSRITCPNFFVVVIVPDQPDEWIGHIPSATNHQTGAFWSRIDVTTLGKQIKVPRVNRLTYVTLAEWGLELQAAFRPAVSA